MIVQPLDTAVILSFYAENDDKTPRELAWDTPGLTVVYKRSDSPIWTTLTLMEGIVGTWSSDAGPPEKYGFVYADRGVSELSLPNNLLNPTFFDDAYLLVAVQVDDVHVCPPLRLDLRGIPQKRAGSKLGGLPTVGQDAGGNPILNEPVQISGVTITNIAHEVWAFLTATVAALNPASFGRYILDKLALITPGGNNGSGGNLQVQGATPTVVVGAGKSGAVVSKATEGSTTKLNVWSQRPDGTMETPATIVYRLDDKATRTSIVPETPLTAGNPTVLIITPAQNAMVDQDAPNESHVITITATFDDDSVATGEFIHQLENLHFL